jgi:HK97 family phage major capsid protein
MNIEQLKATWISAGQKVSDLQASLNMALVDDEKTEDDINALNSQLKAAKAKRDTAKEMYDDTVNEQAQAAFNSPAKPLTPKEEDQKMKFLNDLKGLINGDPAVKALVGSQLDANGDGIGLTIPQDIQTAIRSLKRQYDALEQYVRVEPVGTLSGSRNIEKWTDVTPLANLDDETDTINDNDDPNVTIIKYLIQRYGGISTLTNSLLKDTAENATAYITQWIAKKSTVTRNVKILAALATLPSAQQENY